MNVILLLIDSLNRHDLQAYNPATFVKSPNLLEFARKGVTMTRHFAGSLPCMPARREIIAGRREFPWRGWGWVEAFDDHLADRARRQGAVTAMITDHYHYLEHGSHGYPYSFDGFEFIRGQEFDRWKTRPLEDPPSWFERERRFHGNGDVYYRNVEGFETEDDWFTPKVFRTVRDWLRANRAHEKFFLFIDHFEVHEPFYCIEPYSSLYADRASPDWMVWPSYGSDEEVARFMEEVSPEELAFIRAQYYGKITWVDTYFGMLMQTLSELGLWEDTMVVVTTDHGHDLAFWRNRFGKMPPHHDSHAHLPLMIWHPEHEGGRTVDAVTSTVDLHATIAEALGEVNPPAPHSRSLFPLLKGEASVHRAATLTGTFGSGGLMVADHDHSYTHGARASGPVNFYSGYQPRELRFREAEAGRWIPDVDAPVWKIPFRDVPPHRSFLIEHADDPNAQPDLFADHPDLVGRMTASMVRALEEDACPPEFRERMGL